MKTLFKRLSISLFLGANLCTIILMWLCVALTFVSSSLLPRFSLLTLGFPIFLFVDALFLVFWLLFHARLTWIPIAGALVIGGYILDYCPLHLDRNSNEKCDSTITVVSYNVGHMKGEEQCAELLNFLSTTNADIVCLQELSPSFLTKHKNWIDSSFYYVRQSHSMVILSHFPFLSDTIQINFPTRTNHSTACWIDCYGDSTLLVNYHLESNHLSPEEKDDYTHAILDPHRQTIKSSSHVLMGKLSEAASYRGAQTDTICSFIDRNANYDVILCGDLNETPISYAYQQLASRLSSAYREAGTGPGFTYSQRSFPVHIDHIFFSPHWECTYCHIDRNVLASDHYPLTARLRKKVR